MGLFIHIRTDKPNLLHVERAGGPGSLGAVDVRMRTGSRLDTPGANPAGGFFRPGSAYGGSGKDLPLDYIVEYGSTLEDCVTIRQQIEETLLTGKQSALYEEKVNAFGVKHYETIVYNREAYESLWKNLD